MVKSNGTANFLTFLWSSRRSYKVTNVWQIEDMPFKSTVLDMF